MYKLFVIFHNKLYSEHLFYKPENVVFFGVNSQAIKNIPMFLSRFKQEFEFNLKIFYPMFQECGYNESSAILHIGLNNIHADSEYIGFTQYDIIWNTDSIQNFKSNTCYYAFAGFNDLEYNVFPFKFFLEKYNKFFNKGYDREEVEHLSMNKFRSSTPLIPLLSTFMIHKNIYESLLPFWREIMFALFVYLKINKHPYPKFHRYIAIVMERIIGLSLVLSPSIENFTKVEMREIEKRHENYAHWNNSTGKNFNTPTSTVLKYFNTLDASYYA